MLDITDPRPGVRDIVAKAVAGLQEDGDVPNFGVPTFSVEPARAADRVGYVTDVALKLAAALEASGAGVRAEPLALAGMLAARVRETVAVVPAYDRIYAVEVGEPGLVTLWLKPRPPDEARR
jgi:hypothetical protein